MTNTFLGGIVVGWLANTIVLGFLVFGSVILGVVREQPDLSTPATPNADRGEVTR